MLKEDILAKEKEALETAIIVLQSRVNEIDCIQRGGKPRPVVEVPKLEEPTPPVAPKAEVLSNQDEQILRSAAEEASEARGEKFIAVTNGVSTKRVAKLAKLLDAKNCKHYNIVAGTKVYVVSGGKKVSIGKFTNTNLRGVSLPTGKVQFLFESASFAEKFIGF